MTTLIITVVAVWLAQRLLAVRQAMQFRQQYSALRREGRDVAMGAARKFGRRTYVALAADRRVTTDALVFRGVTVFAKGRDEPRLRGTSVADLAAGRMPAGVHPMICEAAGQAAGFLTTAAGKRARRTVAAGTSD